MPARSVAWTMIRWRPGLTSNVEWMLHGLGRFPLEKLITFYPFKDINQAIEDSLSGKCIKPIVTFEGVH